MIVLEFPQFKDGRGFSWARMLSTRMGYKGEIRASGGFLADQLAFLHPRRHRRLRRRRAHHACRTRPRTGEMTDVYQPAPDGKKTIRDLRAR